MKSNLCFGKQKVFFVFILLIIFSCNKEQHISPKNNQEVSVHPHYDTMAVDSFGPGAEQVNIAENIYKSSAAYQDSLRKLAEKLAAEKENNLLKEALKKDSLKKLKEKEVPAKKEITAKKDSV